MKPSPPRQVLKMFGGILSIDAFRESLIINEKEFRFIMPPMISIIPLIEEDYNESSKNTKLNKFIILNDKKNKRIKANTSDKCMLEQTMGLKYFNKYDES